MSHFAVIVLAPKETENVEAYLAEVLAPYDENMEVENYEEECWCRSSNIHGLVTRVADRQFPTWEEMRKTFWARKDIKDMDDETKDKEWKAYIAKRTEFEKEKKAELEKTTSFDPDCEDCKGTGNRWTNYNPKSKWDWYQIGGRWTGFFSNGEYNPSTDPDNIKTCWLCGGTGKRMDEVGRKVREDNPDYGCNGCDDTGKSVVWPTQFKDYPGDIVPATKWLALLDHDVEKFTTFAIVTPETDTEGSEWLERGRMGWWAIISDAKENASWQGEVMEVIEKHANNCIAVVVDCHI